MQRILDKYNQLLLLEKYTTTVSLRGATSNRSLQDGELGEQALRYSHMIACRQQSVKNRKETCLKFMHEKQVRRLRPISRVVPRILF